MRMRHVSERADPERSGHPAHPPDSDAREATVERQQHAAEV